MFIYLFLSQMFHESTDWQKHTHIMRKISSDDQHAISTEDWIENENKRVLEEEKLARFFLCAFGLLSL